MRLHIKLDEGTVVLSTNKGQEKYAIQNVADVISKYGTRAHPSLAGARAPRIVRACDREEGPQPKAPLPYRTHTHAQHQHPPVF